MGIMREVDIFLAGFSGIWREFASLEEVIRSEWRPEARKISVSLSIPPGGMARQPLFRSGRSARLERKRPPGSLRAASLGEE
jgi:hypothetical protein